MKDEIIEVHDDMLLKKESSLKISRIVFIIIFGLYLAGVIYIAPSGFWENRMSEITTPFFLIIIAVLFTELKLRHIASIKMYRTKIETSQPAGSGYRPPAAGSA